MEYLTKPSSPNSLYPSFPQPLSSSLSHTHLTPSPNIPASHSHPLHPPHPLRCANSGMPCLAAFWSSSIAQTGYCPVAI